MKKTDTATEIWQKYERGLAHHRRIGLPQKTERAHRYFLGDQWYGTGEQDKELPVMNIIAPTVKNKVATVAQGEVAFRFVPIGDDRERAAQAALCEKLSAFAAARWEQFKMDNLCWQVVKDAAIAGDSYLYFYDADGRAEVIDNINIFLGDEQCRDIQRQPYIILSERRRVAEMRRLAADNGIAEKDLPLIQPDEETGELLNEQSRAEVEGEEKCTCLLYLYKDDEGYVHISRSARHLIIQPDTALVSRDFTGAVTGGIRLYPLVSFVWQGIKGSARGQGEVTPMIANQNEINRTLARRATAVKNFAYPKLIYDRDRVEDPDALGEVGAVVAVDGLSGASVGEMIRYLEPAPISSAAEKLSDELVMRTRELSGAGDAAVGAVNPEKASGAAILAVRDLAQLPLNEQIADFKQFAEEVAALWFEKWCVYHPAGLTVTLEDGSVWEIPAELFASLKAGIRVDVSSESPYSRYAEQQAIDNLFSVGAISFEEYVSLLDGASALSKGKLEKILQARKAL